MISDYRAQFMKSRRYRIRPCPACGLHGCICQTKIDEFSVRRTRIRRVVCRRCGLYLCNCAEDARGMYCDV